MAATAPPLIRRNLVSDRTQPSALYLDLLKRCLCGLIYEDVPLLTFPIDVPLMVDKAPQRFIRPLRVAGRDVPSQAHTAIGLRRLDNIQRCVETALADGIPGDLIETGVWRGGATILMRGILKVHGVTDRRVWVADSFQGLPAPDTERYPLDAFWSKSAGRLCVPLDAVKDLFARYQLLDEQVRFLPGWFAETLPGAPIERLAVLRLDGDLYASTMDSLSHLYPKVSPGGFVIVDDYNIESCRRAVEDFRSAQGIGDPIDDIDGWGVYWRRSC